MTDTVTNHRQVTHYNNSVGLNLITACGVSLHGWNLKLPANTTTELNNTTCKRCIKKMSS